jgi:hypothetical protein
MFHNYLDIAVMETEVFVYVHGKIVNFFPLFCVFCHFLGAEGFCSESSSMYLSASPAAAAFHGFCGYQNGVKLVV